MCPRSVVEDEFHLLFECPAYDTIRAKYDQELFAPFGGRTRVVRIMKQQPKKVAAFMDQDPRKVAAYVHECFEHRRNAEHVLVPYFSMEDMGGSVAGVFDTLSSDFVQNSTSSPSSVEDSGCGDAHVGSSRAPPS